MERASFEELFFSIPLVHSSTTSSSLLGSFPRLPRLPLLTATTATGTTAATATLATLTPLAALAVALLLALGTLLLLLSALLALVELGSGQALGELDLGTDGVGEVRDHEDVLDVVVEVVLDGQVGHLGGQGKGVHEVLAERVVAVALLVEHLADEAGNALEQVRDGLEGLGEVLDVGDDGGGARLGIGGGGDGAKSAALGIGEEELVGDLDEEARLGGALGADGHRSGDVGLGLDGRAGLGADGQVDGRVGEGAGLGRGEEVLDQGAEAVELVRGGVPTKEGLARASLEGQGQHVLLVLDVHLDLVLVLGVGDGEGGAHFDLAAVLAADTHEGTDHPCRLGVAVVTSDGMVDDGEDRLVGEESERLYVSYVS